MSRKTGPVENADYFQMVGRMVRGMGKRGANGDYTDLTEMAKVQQMMTEAMQTAVDGMREQQGYSWAEVGEGLGITRQAAQQRFGRKAAKVEEASA